MNRTKIPTSAEVWAVIKARHGNELVVFATYSAPDGDHYGNPQQGVMKTEYGLPGADYPLMGACTTWDIVPAGNVYDRRQNERTEYWLCVNMKDSE